MFLQIEYQPEKVDGGMIIDMMIVIFTEIRHCKELINFLSIFGPQKLCNFDS